ncbi:MAG TPA: 4-(cytidine 5'-diphospho)-2-C-methyl-D-erythritol kinase [Candidatus Kapabacteria bacterium]|nr:4-(cytidine 5'-diphospho)-2-C-methyl-D-erythritol kinase [Candidatus Kapabacteria bacterium]HRK60403.1 4-(cytidine 5'-diphospho)-2-C-methyl-D-erythritol kinase [Candidatus Kapabacteria bacterium]
MPKFTCFPPAKINLFLEVLGKRTDGYHSIHSFFIPVTLCDELTIEKTDDYTITLDSSIDCRIEDNLVWKAARRLQDYFSVKSGAKIRLQKNIPTGAGLGGGSSDAAYTLKMLNLLWNIGADKETLCDIAASLGSDCPFFIESRPAIATGRGEILQTVEYMQHGSILLVHPRIHSNTALAYSHFNFNPEHGIKKPQCLINNMSTYKNDFEESVFAQHPILYSIKDTLYSSGAYYASMTGSGSTMFGIFDNTDTAEKSPLVQQYTTHIVGLYNPHLFETFFQT